MTEEINIQGIESNALKHYKSGEYDKAIHWREIAYAYYRNNYGEYSSQTLKALYNLGKSCRRAKKYEYALNVYHVLYNACVKNYGEVHNGTLLSLNVLVNCYLDLGFNKTVYKLYKEAYETCVKNLGKEHSDTIQALENYAYGCYYVGDYNQALKLTKKLSAANGREEDCLKLFACIYLKSGELKKADKIIAELESRYKPKEIKSYRQEESDIFSDIIKEDEWFFNEHEILFYLTFLAIIYKNTVEKENSNQVEQDIIDVIDNDLIYYILTETDTLVSRLIEEIKKEDYFNINKLSDFIVFLEKVVDVVPRYKPVKKHTIHSSLALFIIKIMKLKEAINTCDYPFSVSEDAFLTDEKQEVENKLIDLAYKIAMQSFNENGQCFTTEDMLLFKSWQENSFPRVKEKRGKKALKTYSKQRK